MKKEQGQAGTHNKGERDQEGDEESVAQVGDVGNKYFD